MESTSYRAIAIVGAGAILPDLRRAFWDNIKQPVQRHRSSIRAMGSGALLRSQYNAPDKTIRKSAVGFATMFGTHEVALGVPPRVVDAMEGRKSGHRSNAKLWRLRLSQRPLDADRTAVILGNAMAARAICPP